MIYIQETYINKTAGYTVGESEVFETRFDSLGELYRAMVKEHGRCISKVYVGEGTPIGWVFIGTDRYIDTREPYQRETWVTVHASMPVRTVSYSEINITTGMTLS